MVARGRREQQGRPPARDARQRVNDGASDGASDDLTAWRGVIRDLASSAGPALRW
jgi:hypothetical protein